MSLMLWLLFFVLVLPAGAAGGVRPALPRYSRFEADRLAQAGDKSAAAQRRLLDYYAQLSSIPRLAAVILLLAAGLLAVGLLGLGWGMVAAAVAVIIYGPLGMVPALVRPAQRLFDRHSDAAAQAIGRSRLLRVLLATPRQPSHDPTIHSAAELAHMINHSPKATTVEQRTLLLNSLQFDSRTVDDIMTPADRAPTIDKRELLGPLVLSDLHRTGHDRFLVVDRTLDAVLGVLYLNEHLTVDSATRSTTAAKAMRPGSTTIPAGSSLRNALALLLRDHRDIALVVDANKTPVGLVTLDDIIGVLLG